MTVIETKERIERELNAMLESFGDARYLARIEIEVAENEIADAPVDTTAIFGTISLGTEDMSDEERLYLPLDAELDDNDIVDDAKFEENLSIFKGRIEMIRNRILSADDYNTELKALIADFDREIEEAYKKELEKLNKESQRRLMYAAIATAAVALIAVIMLVVKQLA